MKFHQLRPLFLATYRKSAVGPPLEKILSMAMQIVYISLRWGFELFYLGGTSKFGWF